MPNGAVDGWCRFCRAQRVVHLRSEDDYLWFVGWYCDAFWDWIEADEIHWQLVALLRMADSSGTHPLSGLIGSATLGHAVAEFLR